MSMATETKDGRWKICYRIPDRKNPITEYFGHGEQGKKDAETRELEIKLAKKKGHIVRGQSGVYLDQLAQLYLDDAKTRGASESGARVFPTPEQANPEESMPKPVDRLDYAVILPWHPSVGGKTTSPYSDILVCPRVFPIRIRYGSPRPTPWQPGSRRRSQSSTSSDRWTWGASTDMRHRILLGP
jgi:hypothetical protein